MSTSSVTGEPVSAAGELPRLETILPVAEQRLAAREVIGLISVTVLKRRHVENRTGWPGYDTIIREIATFLRAYRGERMRREDRLFEPSLNGNSFALLLEPPRDGRELDAV